MDWGSSKPGCVLWGAALPNDHVHIFDELKFKKDTHPNARSVAEDVVSRSKQWGLDLPTTTYADPSLGPDATGQIGESIGTTLGRHGLPLIYVSNRRVNGWQRVHEALAIDPAEGTPWLTVHPRCRYLIRTMPLMVQAKNEPEDLDSESDDHACDALRYLLMGNLRPFAGRIPLPVAEPYSLAWYRKMFRNEPRGVLA
jgi:hypothetical protein